MKMTTGMDRSQFHDKAWALWQEKALASALLPKLSIHALRTLWDVLYDAMPQPQAAEPKGLTDAMRSRFQACLDHHDKNGSVCQLHVAVPIADLRALLAKGE